MWVGEEAGVSLKHCVPAEADSNYLIFGRKTL